MPNDCQFSATFPFTCISGDRCILHAAHRRLEEAHRHWHHALEQYSHRDNFRTYLNGTLQAARNVTFMIQSAKAAIPDFANWYGGWQTALRNDSLMKWAVDSRNRVVKSSDLDSFSQGKVTLVGSSNYKAIYTCAVDPTTSNISLAAELASRLPPATESFRKSGILKVERRWIDKALPDNELLLTLSHVVGRLSQIVVDCHRQINQACTCDWVSSQCSTQEAQPDTTNIITKPPCMVAFQDRFTAWIRLCDGSEVAERSTEISFDAKDEATIQERYGHIAARSMLTALQDRDLTAKAHALWGIASKVMETDGFHIHSVWLLRQGQLVWLGALDIPDNASKHVAWDALRNNVERYQADEVITISERWSAPFDPNVPDRRAEDHADRREWLGIDILRSDGEFISLLGEVRRDDARTIVEPPVEHREMSPLYLDDVKRLWGLLSA